MYPGQSFEFSCSLFIYPLLFLFYYVKRLLLSQVDANQRSKETAALQRALGFWSWPACQPSLTPACAALLGQNVLYTNKTGQANFSCLCLPGFSADHMGFACSYLEGDGRPTRHAVRGQGRSWFWQLVL